MKITIVGGGSSAHTLIPMLSHCGHEVSLLTQRPNSWGSTVTMQVRDVDNVTVQSLTGRLARAAADPAAVIPEADIIVLCLPVHQYRNMLHQIAPHVSRRKKQWIGCIYGQAGVNWMMREIIRKFRLEMTGYFAFGLLPWICRIEAYGHCGINYGPKTTNVAAVYPRSDFAWLNECFFQDICFRYFGRGAVRQAENFLSLTLSADNQIIHPARCYGLFRRYGDHWNSEEAIPYFYRDFDEESADILQRLDDEYSLVRNRIIARFPGNDFQYMLNYLELEKLSYHSCNTDIRQSFVESKTLHHIKPPVVFEKNRWTLDKNHRFFRDDINYGLCIAKWFADQLDIPTPMIDIILQWAKTIRSESYSLEKGLAIPEADRNGFSYGIPPVYGLESIDQVIAEEQ